MGKVTVYLAIMGGMTYTKIYGAFFSEEEAKRHILENTFGGAEKYLDKQYLGGEMRAIMSSHIKNKRHGKCFDIINNMRVSKIRIISSHLISYEGSALVKEIRESLLGCKIPGRTLTRLEQLEKSLGGAPAEED